MVNGSVVTIHAGTKTTGNGSTVTNCGFFDSAGKYLGQFQSTTPDPGPLKEFCVNNFDNRTV